MLTLRGLLIVLALGGIVGLIDAREFIGLFPFNVQIILDVVAVAIFLFLAWGIPTLLPEKKKFVIGLVSLVWLYTIAGNAGNLWIFVSALGLSEALEYLGTTLIVFMLIQTATLILLPTLIFALFWWCVERVSV
jgi:hypothetical protein